MNLFQSITQTYLNKFSDATKLITVPVDKDCKHIIVIPSYNETSVELVLNALTACAPPVYAVEIIVVFNCAEDEEFIDNMHQVQIKQLNQKFKENNNLKIHFINIPFIKKKDAGVGYARKKGMDEAVRRFKEINYDGLITCLDADCTVSENYLCELEKFAVNHESYNVLCLAFEHKYKEENDPVLKKGIIYYELFLRHYKEALKWTGFPYYFYTIGSSMAVKTSVYCKGGGMNKRKAGEDFYFLHKLFVYGKTTEVNSLRVYPSARISKRVPFGTGRAQQQFYENPENTYVTYNFKIFEEFKLFLDLDLYALSVDEVNEKCPEALLLFLKQVGFEDKLKEIKNNSSGKEQFYKRFFFWMNGFLILKFIHFARDNFYVNENILSACDKLFSQLKKQTPDISEAENWLQCYKKCD